MTGGRRGAVLIVGGLAAIVFVAYLRPLVAGDTFAQRDHPMLTVPARAHLAETLRSGSVPEWWDGVGMGAPFAANPMHGATYPPAWLVAALPEPLGADLLAILHVLLLGLGAAALSRRLGADPLGAVVAGGALMCCGYTASMVVNGVPLIAMAWTPWVAWAAEGVARADRGRARVRAAAVVCALYAATIVAGDPAVAITTGWLALLWAPVRAGRRDRLRALAATAAALAGAFVLAAATVVPALGLLSESRRAGGITHAVGAWSLHPLRLGELVAPHMLGDATEPGRTFAGAVANTSQDPTMGPGWSLSLYLGAPALLLTVAAARLRGARLGGLALASLAFVVLALGTYGLVWSGYRLAFLPERVIRFPERHILGALVIWTALAGVGFSAAFRDSALPRLWRAGAAMTATLVGWVIAVAALRATHSDAAVIADPGGAFDAMLAGAIEAAVVAAAVTAALWLAANRAATGTHDALGQRGRASRSTGPGPARRERYRAALPAAAAAVIVGQLVGHGWSVHTLIDRAVLERPPHLLAHVPDRDRRPPPRLYRDRTLLPRAVGGSQAERVVALYDTATENAATRWGMGYVPGYDPALPARLRALWERGAAAGDRLLARLAVDYVVIRLPPGAQPGPAVVGVSGDGSLALVRPRVVRPRAFATSSWRRVRDDDAAIRAVIGDASLSTIHLVGGDEDHTTGDPPAPCTVESPRPELVRLHCHASRDGYAVLLDAWAPGWTATVDGKPAAVERADVVARAVAIDAGRHVIEMRYRTPGLRIGAVVALLGWLCWLTVLLITRPSDPRAARNEPQSRVP